MDNLFEIYFGQDFDIFGETVPEIVARYKKDFRHHYQKLIREIDLFRNRHPNDLDTAFHQRYWRHFSAEPWGYTTVSFLEEVQRLLRE
ncbi:hypothetical protein LJ656_13265 [Paraburkholderia sp. MMS20-SJTR3]|uniref:CdiI immunity protein domain-containing protein n=1 Tax=Paraburkholderia sejongensis TaxID=2886946 RepID=A0ABS8JUI1_9BURK|nr:contact-dependent growth inhibition system immunity protein [Paraburkholderia sp. MMS20-SJTR3]MCC8393561.1 hypothetical protein [Paraburkholderia sp. MMS20-SJTR3]